MKLWEIAKKAINDHNPKLAKGLMIRLENKELNYQGSKEFLTSKGVDWPFFEEVLKEAS